MNTQSAFAGQITAQIATFLEAIGLATRPALVATNTFLPGIAIEDGVIFIDESRLKYPGDLLHEAGHLAVMPAALRKTVKGNAGADAGEEMAAIAWSYAAALYLGIDPAVVFHPDGYRGGSQAILDNFAAGCYFGVPMLQWLGMTVDEKRAAELNLPPYPHMMRWLAE